VCVLVVTITALLNPNMNANNVRLGYRKLQTLVYYQTRL
jgi:hypothetical protein